MAARTQGPRSAWPRGRQGRSRAGFTLVELLVVMAIIAVLMAVLLPAIQSARESARAATCRNHVGQLAKAMLHYEASQQSFPSGGWGDVWLGVAERGGGVRQPGGWTFSILPFLDEEALLGKVTGISAGDAAASYQDLASTSLPVFACPSRRTSRALTTAGQYRGALDTSVSLPVATRSDYAANGGSSGSCPPLEVYRSIASDPLLSSKSVQVCHATGNNGGGNTLSVSIPAMFGNGGHGNHSGDYVGVCLQCSGAVVVTSPTSLSQGDTWTQESLAAKVANRADGGLPDLQDGIVFRMSAITSAAIRDGMANTYLLGEKAVAADRYGAGTDAGDTAPLFVGYSDDNLRWAFDTPDRDLPGVSRPQAFGTPHYGGVSMALADGSVRTIPSEIDWAVHKALAGRNDRIIASPP